MRDFSYSFRNGLVQTLSDLAGTEAATTSSKILWVEKFETDCFIIWTPCHVVTSQINWEYNYWEIKIISSV